MKCRLTSLELCLYFILWTAACLYSLYILFQDQNDILNNNRSLQIELEELEPGWSLLSRLKDGSDMEWISWRHFILIAGPYFILQFIGSEVIRRTALSYLKHWYIFSTSIFITLIFGYRHLLLILVQPLFYATIIFGGGRKVSIFTTSLFTLLIMNTAKYKSFMWTFLDHKHVSDEEVYMLVICLPWIQLRCMSYCIDYIEQGCNTFINPIQSIADMVSYVLYAPVLHTGPVILYEDFAKSFKTEPDALSLRIRKFVFDACIFLVYSFVMDLVLHYIYFYALQSDIETVKKFSTQALCGGMLYMGQQFHLKYVIAYGTSTAFARLDNIEPPPTPRCIARIHIYSDMWRYFDVGLYKFLVKYIYIPSYNNISTYVNWPKYAKKLLASFATYLFIYLWHGMLSQIFIWTLFNFIGITVEYLAKAIAVTDFYKQFKRKIIRTEEMEIRFIALISTPMLALSSVNSVYLFANTEIGNFYFYNFTHPTLKNSLLILVATYTCCQCSMALRNVPSRQAVKKTVKFVE